MSSAVLLLLLGLGQLPGSPSSHLADPAALVQELGAPRFAERQAASESLERLGALALPSLRLAVDSRDMEIKTRARSLLLKIETALLTQPTSVRMKFDGQALNRSRPVAQRANRFQDCSLPAKPTTVEKSADHIAEPPASYLLEGRRRALRRRITSVQPKYAGFRRPPRPGFCAHGRRGPHGHPGL